MISQPLPPPHRAEYRSPPAIEPGTWSSATSWVNGVLVETGKPTAHVTSLRVLRDGVKRLAVVEFVDGAPLVLKQYADDRGAWTQLWLQRLVTAGFGPPGQLGVTPARGWSRTHRTLVTDLAPDHPWTSWLVGAPDARSAAARAAADWLTALQSLELTLPVRTGYRAGADLERQSAELAAAFPGYAMSITALHRAVQARLYGPGSSGATVLVPSHGDLHPNNLHIVDGSILSVMAIDVDTAGLRRPAYDVGYALAQLLIGSWMRTGSFHAGAAAGLVFWHRWTSDGGRDAGAVAAESVRALMQSLHFELVTYRNGRTNILDLWLGIAHSLLTNGLPTTLHRLVTAEEDPS